MSSKKTNQRQHRKLICAGCARQIIKGHGKGDQYIVYSMYVYPLIGGKVFCQECGEELDKDGLFPEEREQELRLRRRLWKI